MPSVQFTSSDRSFLCEYIPFSEMCEMNYETFEYSFTRVPSLSAWKHSSYIAIEVCAISFTKSILANVTNAVNIADRISEYSVSMFIYFTFFNQLRVECPLYILDWWLFKSRCLHRDAKPKWTRWNEAQRVVGIGTTISQSRRPNRVHWSVPRWASQCRPHTHEQHAFIVLRRPHSTYTNAHMSGALYETHSKLGPFVLSFVWHS